MNVRILPSAFNDLVAGREFYNLQGEGLGSYFFDSPFADIDSLRLYGGVHRKVFGHHRMLSERFPYAIYYKIENENTAVVLRVLDCRQNPRKTRRALR